MRNAQEWQGVCGQVNPRKTEEKVAHQMDCSRVLSQIASLSADELSLEETDAMHRHFQECPPCQGHWVLFTQTLLTLSTTPQPLVTLERSQQMWLVCVEHARQKQAPLQAPQSLDQSLDQSLEAAPNSQETQNQAANPAQGQVVATPPFRVQPARAKQAAAGSRTKSASSWRGWFAGQPRLGWALVGGAAAALGAAYFAAPPPEPASSRNLVAVVQPLPASSDNSPGQLVTFRTPPRMAASMVGHHAAMSFDPFADHVGPTLISSSASAESR